MAVASTRTVTVTFSGDRTETRVASAANNAASPGSETLHTLATGDNTITLPTGGSTPTSATIIPPTANAQALVLKGAGGDTGLTINKTDPTTLTFGAAPAATFIINSAGAVTGLRIIWA